MIENILYRKLTLAIIVYDRHKQSGIEYFSSKNCPLQLGYMKRPKGYEVVAHIHKPVLRKTKTTQEVLFVKKGIIHVDFYSPKKEFVQSRRLSAGDTVLFAAGGHGIEVLKEAVIVEVKNGPFVEGQDKIRFKTTKRVK